MSIKKFISLESELEVDKLLDRELQADEGGEFDNLYNDIIENKELEEDKEEDDSDSDVNTASESFRQLNYEISTEELSDIGTSVNILLAGTIVLVRDAIKALASIGIHYGPIILSKVYKGLLFAITKLVNTLFNSIVEINNYRIRHSQSFTNLKEDIAKLKKSLNAIDEKPDNIKDITFSNSRVINSLKISDSVNVADNLKVLEDFLDYVINSISLGINNDLEAIKHLISFSMSKTAKNPSSLMIEQVVKSKLVSGTVQGYEENSDYIESYSYDKTLPGDIKFIAQLPVNSIDNIDDFAKAYNNSSMFLGFDNNNFKQVDSIPYLSKSDLLKLLNILDGICTLGLHHVQFYTDIENKKKSLRYSFRLYISSIISASTKINMKASMIDYINLKSIFIDKVYLAGAMDIHDYTIKIITNANTFIKDNIIKLS